MAPIVAINKHGEIQLLDGALVGTEVCGGAPISTTNVYCDTNIYCSSDQPSIPLYGLKVNAFDVAALNVLCGAHTSVPQL